MALLSIGSHARHPELDVGAFVGSGLTVPAGQLATSSAIPIPRSNALRQAAWPTGRNKRKRARAEAQPWTRGRCRTDRSLRLGTQQQDAWCSAKGTLSSTVCSQLGGPMPKGAFNPIDKHVGSRVRMRRLMLDMSQTDLGDALGLTFQQVQKYEKGANRIGASPQHLSQILQVPVPFFFEGAPASIGRPAAEASADASSPSFVSDFLATSEGLNLVRAFTCIEDAKLRRAIVRLVEQIAPDDA